MVISLPVEWPSSAATLEDCPDALVESMERPCIRSHDEVGLGGDGSYLQATFEIPLPA